MFLLCFAVIELFNFQLFLCEKLLINSSSIFSIIELWQRALTSWGAHKAKSECASASIYCKLYTSSCGSWVLCYVLFNSPDKDKQKTQQPWNESALVGVWSESLEEESAENCLCLKEFKLKEIKLYSFVVEWPSVQLKMWVKFIVHSFFLFFFQWLQLVSRRWLIHVLFRPLSHNSFGHFPCFNVL